MKGKIKAILATILSLQFATVANATDYGLAPSIQEGVILHCFDWPYSSITAELENIAEAGFTAVQTSPAQVGVGSTNWYWLYQPLGFYLGTNDLGTVSELQTLCTEAHKLGIFVVVDVVANHLAGDHTNIQSDLLDSQYWHTYGSSIDYTDRYAITHGDIGMQDIASENTYVQSCVKGYIQDLVDIGVDGIRWDAAKHIDLPSEYSSQFWPAVTTTPNFTTNLGNSLWHYGEILVGPTDNGSGSSSDQSLMKEYTTYISVTDNTYGNSIRSQMSNSYISSGYSNWSQYVGADKVVYWAESHDTYSNESQESTWVSESVIDRTWALVASRAEATALYFSRPSATSNSTIYAGVKGSTHFTSTEVAAVNHLHNACIGEEEYWVNNGSVVAVCRESGAVIVVASGSSQSVSVSNGDGTGFTATGTYTDEISGNTFTVTSSTISGTVGSTGIAVIYSDSRPRVSLSPSSGTTFTSETLDVTLTVSNATSATVQVDDGAATTFTSSSYTVTIGEGVDYGESITISYTATNGTSTTEGTATYKKRDPNATITIYCQSSSAPYLYAWDTDENSINGAWPGTKMSNTTTISGTTYYYTTFADYDEINIIFNDGTNQTDDITGITEDAYFYWDGGSNYTVLDAPTSDSDDDDDDDDDDGDDDDDDDTGDDDDDDDSLSYYLIGDLNDWTVTSSSSSSSNGNSSSSDDDDDSSSDSSDGITIYVSGSSSYYMYVWDTSTDTAILNSWPGNQFSTLNSTTVSGTTYYYYTFTGYSSLGVIFNTGNGGNQTGDITVTATTYFSYSGGSSATVVSGGSSSSDSSSSSSDGITVYVSGSSSYYMYAWYDGVESVIGSWPGTQFSDLSSTTVSGTTYYYYTFTEGSPVYVIFNTGYSGNQTGTLTVTSDTYYSYSGGTSASTVSVSSAAQAKSASVKATATGGVKAYITTSSPSSYYIWAWDANTQTTNYTAAGAWPGDQLSSLPTAKGSDGNTYYYLETGGSSIYVILNEGSTGSQTDSYGPYTSDVFLTYNGGTSLTVNSGVTEAASYDDTYLFTAQDEYLVLSVDQSTLESTGLGFQIIDTDGTTYSCGSTVEYDTEYTFSSSSAQSTLASTPSNGYAVFVITSVESSSSIKVKVIDSSTSVVDSDVLGITDINGDESNILILTTGNTIEVVGTDDVAVYNLSGSLISRSTSTSVDKGIYIVRTGSTATKIMVR